MYKSTLSLSRIALRGFVGFACLACVQAYGAKFKVTLENIGPDDGLWITPMFFGFHDGSFDTFDPGANASSFPGIKEVAEAGDPSVIAGRFGSDANAGAKHHVLLAKDSAMGPPEALFAPSNFNPMFSSMNSFMISLSPTANRFLSFASMIVPSNDAFLSNPDPTAYELFTAGGMFKDGFQIDLYGSDIWDSGTEMNDPMGGAAFSALGGMSTATDMPISMHPGLDDFVGTPLAIGEDLGYAFSGNTPVARITVEQVPDHAPFAASLGAAALFGFRLFTARKRRKGNRA